MINKEKKISTEFCKMNSNNQITVPKHIRDLYIGGNLEENQTVLFEVKFIRIIQPTSEEQNKGGK